MQEYKICLKDIEKLVEGKNLYKIKETSYYLRHWSVVQEDGAEYLKISQDQFKNLFTQSYRFDYWKSKVIRAFFFYHPDSKEMAHQAINLMSQYSNLSARLPTGVVEPLMEASDREEFKKIAKSYFEGTIINKTVQKKIVRYFKSDKEFLREVYELTDDPLEKEYIIRQLGPTFALTDSNSELREYSKKKMGLNNKHVDVKALVRKKIREVLGKNFKGEFIKYKTCQFILDPSHKTISDYTLAEVNFEWDNYNLSQLTELAFRLRLSFKGKFSVSLQHRQIYSTPHFLFGKNHFPFSTRVDYDPYTIIFAKKDHTNLLSFIENDLIDLINNTNYLEEKKKQRRNSNTTVKYEE